MVLCFMNLFDVSKSVGGANANQVHATALVWKSGQTFMYSIPISLCYSWDNWLIVEWCIYSFNFGRFSPRYKSIAQIQ